MELLTNHILLQYLEDRQLNSDREYGLRYGHLVGKFLVYLIQRPLSGLRKPSIEVFIQL